MKDLLFIINPSAGRTHIKSRLFDVIDLFSRADYNVTVYPTKCKHDATDIVMKCGATFDLIVCAGGDGTLDEVVTGIMESACRIPLGYIPAGTTNDYGRSLRIPKNPVSAVNNILNGNPYPVDVGSINGSYFIYVASFGAFTDVAYSTNQHFKNVFGHAAYVMNGIASLSSITSYTMTISYDDQTFCGEYIYGMITNSLSIGGILNLSNRAVEFDDGVFECLFIRTPQTPAELQAIISSLLLNEVNPDYMTFFKASRIEITGSEAIDWGTDGEYAGCYETVVIENHQKSLSIMTKYKPKGTSKGTLIQKLEEKMEEKGLSL